MRTAVSNDAAQPSPPSRSACTAAEHAAKTSGATIRMSILFESHTGLLNGAAGIVENGTSSWPTGRTPRNRRVQCSQCVLATRFASIRHISGSGLAVQPGNPACVLSLCLFVSRPPPVTVILMGATIPKSLDDWGKVCLKPKELCGHASPNAYSSERLQARRVVSGRFINCYSSNDWVLSLIFRYQTFALSAAGLSAVTLRASDAVFGIVENRDMSHLISRHGDYSIQSKTILLELGFGADVTPLGI